jgi:hypothetical protein
MGRYVIVILYEYDVGIVGPTVRVILGRISIYEAWTKLLQKPRGNRRTCWATVRFSVNGFVATSFHLPVHPKNHRIGVCISSTFEVPEEQVLVKASEWLAIRLAEEVDPIPMSR